MNFTLKVWSTILKAFKKDQNTGENENWMNRFKMVAEKKNVASNTFPPKIHVPEGIIRMKFCSNLHIASTIIAKIKFGKGYSVSILWAPNLTNKWNGENLW